MEGDSSSHENGTEMENDSISESVSETSMLNCSDSGSDCKCSVNVVPAQECIEVDMSCTHLYQPVSCSLAHRELTLK
jgi:hypothetical protein